LEALPFAREGKREEKRKGKRAKGFVAYKTIKTKDSTAEKSAILNCYGIILPITKKASNGVSLLA